VQGRLALRVLHATSSPTLLAGHRPNTALAVSHFADDALEHRAGVAVQLAGLGADDLVVRIAGNLPASSQAWKNGVQSM
jgi:hypothetical protein